MLFNYNNNIYNLRLIAKFYKNLNCKFLIIFSTQIELKIII